LRPETNRIEPTKRGPCVAYLETYKKTRELVGRRARAKMPEEMKQMLRQFLPKQLANENP
jgi:hypothetical protein